MYPSLIEKRQLGVFMALNLLSKIKKVVWINLGFGTMEYMYFDGIHSGKWVGLDILTPNRNLNTT